MSKANHLNRRQVTAGILLSAIAAPSVARGQSAFPDHSLRMILPYTPGGATDTVARLVAQKMTDIMGQQVVVENRTGAGGTIGTREGVRAESDGYTILFGNVSTLVLNSYLYKSLPYDPAKDLKPIALISDVPNVLVVNQTSEINSVSELIETIKKDPGKYSYGTAGNGTIMHLSTVLFEKLTGTQMKHVPYRGSLPAMQDVIAGRLLMMFDNISGPLPLIQGGKLKPLAVSTEQRVPALSNVPTFAEAGLKGFVNKSWFGLCTQAGTPEAIHRQLEKAALAAIDHPDTRKRLEELGNIPRPLDSAGFAKFWQDEATYWKPIVEMSGIQLD